MNILTMSLDEIKNLENIAFAEDEYNIYITPDLGYYLMVEDFPEYKTYYTTVTMLKQANYSQIIVKPMFDPSINDVSLSYDVSLLDEIAANSSIMADSSMVGLTVDASLFNN